MQDNHATLNDARIEALLVAIQNFKALPPAQQEALEPVYRETLERFKELQHASGIIQDFLSRLPFKG